MRTELEDKLIEFKNWLVTMDYRKNTIHLYLTAVQSFFSKNRVNLRFNRGDLKIETKHKVETKWVPNNSEAGAIYNFADVRDRVILLLMYQSEFLPADISTLKIEELPNLMDHSEGQHYYITRARHLISIKSRFVFRRILIISSDVVIIMR